jgi:hypothetical protein
LRECSPWREDGHDHIAEIDLNDATTLNIRSISVCLNEAVGISDSHVASMSRRVAEDAGKPLKIKGNQLQQNATWKWSGGALSH